MENSNFQENIKNILEVSANDDTIRKIIRVLSFFLTQTNKNYYYTETYLNDYVDECISHIKLLKNRKKFIDCLYRHIKEEIICNVSKIRLDIDNIWYIIKNQDVEWEINYLENGSIGLIDKQKIHITYYLSLKDQVIDYYKEYTINNPLDIVADVLKQIKYFSDILENDGEQKNESETKNYAEQII